MIINPRRIDPLVNQYAIICGYIASHQIQISSRLPEGKRDDLGIQKGEPKQGQTMRFQVLSSAVQYFNPMGLGKAQVQLSFSVFPCGDGELKFSDGSRLVGRNLSKKWGEPITVEDLFGKTNRYPAVLNDGGSWPISATVIVSPENIKDIKFLENEEFACGYAFYHSTLHGKGLVIRLSVHPTVFDDLLKLRLDLPSETFFQIDMPGIKREPYSDRNDIEGFWDLDDRSDCGKADCRVVTDFNIERESSYLPSYLERETLDAQRTESKKEIETVRSLVAELVAIEKGVMDGAVVKLLRLNLLAASVIVVIGVAALASLYL